jgi:hypothetical protein
VPSNNNAFSAFAYTIGKSAGVAYKADTHRALTIAVPFECISDANLRAMVMKTAITFLLEHNSQ